MQNAPSVVVVRFCLEDAAGSGIDLVFVLKAAGLEVYFVDLPAVLIVKADLLSPDLVGRDIRMLQSNIIGQFFRDEGFLNSGAVL